MAPHSPFDSMTERFSRRSWLQNTALGFGSVALAGLSHQAAQASPLSVRPTHFAPRAKRVIFLFMQGGQSQMDLFDPKPELNRRSGQEQGKQEQAGTDRTAGLRTRRYAGTTLGQKDQSPRHLSRQCPQ